MTPVEELSSGFEQQRPPPADDGDPPRAQAARARVGVRQLRFPGLGMARPIALAAAFLGATGPAHAQTAGEPPPEASASNEYNEMSLEELLNVKVVTASGKEEERFLASATVRVVTRDQIERHGYRSLAELLAAVPGLYVVDDLVAPSLSVRGVSGGLYAGTRIVRVMIDGVQVNFRPDLNAFLGPEYIPMEAVERVEIALGPLSALYGANAFLATVNVVTRAPKPGVSAETAVRVTQMRGRVGVGDSGLITARKGRTSLTAAYVLQDDDRSGLALQRTYPAQDPASPIFAGRSAHDLARGKGAYLALRSGSDKVGTVSVVGGLQQLDAMGEFRVNSLFTHGNRLVLRNYWSRATWDAPCISTLCPSLSAGFAHGAPTDQTALRLTGSQGFAFLPNYAYSAWNGDAKVDWTPLEALSFRLGVDGEYDDEHVLSYTQVFQRSVGNMRAGDRVDVARNPGDRRSVVLTDIGAYLQASSTPLPELLPDLHLTGNVRADTIQQGNVSFPLQVSWRTAAAYKFSRAVAAKIVAGHAFQTPSGVLAFARPGFGTVGNIVGNESITPRVARLRPQTVTSVEGSASVKPIKELSFEGGLYYQELQDPIEFVRYGANYRAVNRKETRRNVGVEATLRFAISRYSAYLTGSYQRTLAEGKLVSPPPEAFPNFFGVFGVDLGLPEAYLHANAEWRWVSERGASQANVWLNNGRFYTLRAYGVVDVTLSTIGLRWLGDSTETRFLFGARNLLDARYSEPGYGGFDIPSLGRVLFAEARLLL